MSNKRSAQVLIASVVLLAAVTRPAFAYIDPGTGMSFISGIGAFIAGFIAISLGAIVLTFKRWMAFMKGLFKKKDGGDHPR